MFSRLLQHYTQLVIMSIHAFSIYHNFWASYKQVEFSNKIDWSIWHISWMGSKSHCDITERQGVPGIQHAVCIIWYALIYYHCHFIMSDNWHKTSYGQDIVSAETEWKYTNHCIPPNNLYLSVHSCIKFTVLEYSTTNSLFSRFAKSHSNALYTTLEFNSIERIQEM